MNNDLRGSLSSPLSVWKERDSIDGREVDALVMILKTRGCCWAMKAGCTMCGYNQTNYPESTQDDIEKQVDAAMLKYEDEPYMKIFTSGSFLDDVEIAYRTQERIISKIGSRREDIRLLIESRPEFVSKGTLSGLSGKVGTLEIAVGLETASDSIRAENIRKGFTWKDFVRCADTVLETGCSLKSYLLLKPPMIGEADAIHDCISSIGRIHESYPGSRISINPMNIQTGTAVESLFRRGLYRPPWLWSLVEVLESGYEITSGITHLMSSPTAGGKKRGVHNCGECDAGLLDSIRDFSLENDPSKLNGIYHNCRELWKEDVLSSVSSPIHL